MFLGLNLNRYYADPAQPLTPADKELDHVLYIIIYLICLRCQEDDLDHDLSDVSSSVA